MNEVNEIITLAKQLADSAPYLFGILLIVLAVVFITVIRSNSGAVTAIIRLIDTISDGITRSKAISAELQDSNRRLREILERERELTVREGELTAREREIIEAERSIIAEARTELEHTESGIEHLGNNLQSAQDILQQIREQNNVDSNRK